MKVAMEALARNGLGFDPFHVYGSEKYMLGIMCDLDGTILFTNSRHTALGYNPSEVNGTNAFDYIHPIDFCHFHEKISFMIQSKESVELKMEIRQGNGSWAGIRVKCMPILEGDRICGYFIFGKRRLSIHVSEYRQNHVIPHENYSVVV